MPGNYKMGDFKSLTAITASSAFANASAPQYLTGATLKMSDVETGSLSATVTVDAETNTLTISHQWQVSVDASTWVTCAPSNNAATVVLATGTSGADAAVTAVLEANAAVYGFPFARIRLVTGVATADGTNDIGGAIYRYREPLA